METATLSSKGQVVIPKPLREAHRWTAGTRLVVEDSPDGILLRAASPFPPTELSEGLGCTGYPGPAVTVEEMDGAVGREIRKRWGKRAPR
jgi:AbrB family looped-hinge helix DNA binding protein